MPTTDNIFQERPEPSLRIPPVSISLGFGLITVVGLLMQTPSTSIQQAPEEALVTFVWSAALVLACWWTLSLTLCLLANYSQSAVLHRISLRITLPLARRMARGSVALGLVALPSCASQQTTQPEMVLVESGVPTSPPLSEISVLSELPPLLAEPTTSTTTTAEVATSEPSTTATSPTSTSLNTDSTDSTDSTIGLDTYDGSDEEPSVEPAKPSHTVMQGENLWSIARGHLIRSGNPDPTTAEVGTYWAGLLEANRSLLISGDPNLIYPGEVLQMPIPAAIDRRDSVGQLR